MRGNGAVSSPHRYTTGLREKGREGVTVRFLPLDRSRIQFLLGPGNEIQLTLSEIIGSDMKYQHSRGRKRVRARYIIPGFKVQI